MAKERRSLGGNAVRLAFGAVGLFLLLYPAASVWRLSGEVLDIVPADIGERSTDDRHRLALFDSGDFVLAERTYTGVSALEVRAELQAAGFQGGTLGGAAVLSSECCGSYDAVTVELSDLDGGDTLALISVADADITLSWPLLFAPGLFVLGFVWLSLRVPTVASAVERGNDQELLEA